MTDLITDETVENFVELAKKIEELAKTLNCSFSEAMKVAMKTAQSAQQVRTANAKIGRNPVEIHESIEPRMANVLDFLSKKPS